MWSLMCRYANAFISGLTREKLLIPQPPVGLQVSIDDKVEEGVQGLIGSVDGVYLIFHDGHCLCQYDEWQDLFRYVEHLRRENNLDSIQLVVYWSGTTYESKAPLYIDTELDILDERPEEGRVFKVGVSIPRRLELHLGKATRMIMKSGRRLDGVLESYDSQGEYGSFRTQDGEVLYFSASEVQSVDV